MSGPLILIVGSADSTREDYNPPLINPGDAPAAAKAIGTELGRRGCRIVVYSASKSYLEADVVRGFVGSVKKTAKSMIEVRYPHSAPKSAEFAETKLRPDLFVPTQDRNTSWEATFYASLRDADGVLIIGGGRSAHAVGYMALASEVPILPLACFGGAGESCLAGDQPQCRLANSPGAAAHEPTHLERRTGSRGGRRTAEPKDDIAYACSGDGGCTATASRREAGRRCGWEFYSPPLPSPSAGSRCQIRVAH